MNESNFGRGSDFSRNMKGPKAQPEVAGSVNRQTGTYGFDVSGKMLSDKKYKLLYFLSFFGVPGVVYAAYIMYSKKNNKDGVKEYVYDNMTRSKVEKIAGLALMLTIIYGFIILYFFNQA
ncbi:MAG: hypothetical protein ACPGVH_00595, partial [Chitinophagales bacterium]